jgi:hypothetical protein
VGCQNYDDQFDDLNAQISALKSQVDGLSSLSGQVSSLSGTISGLSSGVAAAQASAASASAAASAIDLSGLSASLATLQTEVDAVQASLATAATAAAVTALQAELDGIETDLADLLSSSNIYSTDVTVTNATTLNSALALGNKINVLNATLTITGYASMDYASVQTLVNRVNTMTGNLVYSAYDSTGTEIVFNNLTSAGNLDVTQPGGYSFPVLANAGTVNLQNNYVTQVTNVSFPALTTVTDMQTEGASTDKFTVSFSAATNVDFGAMVNTPGTTVEITTKKASTLDLGSWNSKNAAGTYVNQTLTLNGPASFTNGTAAGTFASTGLPGNTVGSHDGTINLTNVATAAVHNFRGALNVNAGVENFTGNNVTGITLTSASGLKTLNLTMIRDNDPGLSSTAVTADATSANTEQNITISSTHAVLTSITATGKVGTIDIGGAPALTTIDLTGADAFDISVDNNPALTSYTGALKAMNFTLDTNATLTSVSTAHTSKVETGDTANSVVITDNAELTSATLSMDDVDVLTITGNAKLATISGSALADNATSTTTSVTISNNALVASLVKDNAEAVTLTAAQVGTSADLGAITSTSGLSGLDTYLADAKAATGTVSVWFDTVTKYETQSTYGGAYTNSTSSLTAPTSYNATEAAAAASKPYVYMYEREVATGTTAGAISKERTSAAWELHANMVTGEQVTTLGAAEGIIIETPQGDYQFDTGDSYSGAASGGTVSTIADLIGYMTAQTQTNVGSGIDVTAAQDGAKRAIYSMNYISSTGANAIAGVVSTLGNLYFTFGTDDDGSDSDAALNLVAVLAAGDTVDDIADAVMTAINSDGLYAASSAAGGNGNLFYVTKNVSGTSTADNSPMATFPTIVFDTATATNTAILTPSSYDALISGSSVSAHNTRGTASSFFSLSADATLVKSGVRVTLTNDQGAGAKFAVADDGMYRTDGHSMYIVGANSNTTMRTNNVDHGNKTATPAEAGYIAPGVNMSAYAATTNETPANYDAAFSAISAGTTTGAITAISTDRTGW